MAGSGWLADQRTEVAADRILDAAAELFARHGPGSVGMGTVAGAAGCSRATLYRYFENRDALHTAYVHREANAAFDRIAAALAGVTDRPQRLLGGITHALALVRQNPALSAWFAKTEPPLGAEMADRSEVITPKIAAFLASLDSADAEAPDVIERRARWLVRAMTSLLLFPGRDADDEHAMLTEFVAPVVAPRIAPSVAPTVARPPRPT